MPSLSRFAAPNWLPVGTTLNSYGDEPFEDGNLIDRVKHEFSRRVLYPVIRGYQRREYPHSQHTDAVHSIIKVAGSGDGGFWQSCTVPRTFTSELGLLRCCKYRAFEYIGLKDFGAVQWAAFQNARAKLDGTAYDTGQLVGILIHQILGYSPKPLSSWNPFIEFSKKQKVCSVHCATLLTAAYNTLPKPRAFERPSGNKHIEHLCPADFENLLDNLVQDFPTPLYECIWEHKSE